MTTVQTRKPDVSIGSSVVGTPIFICGHPKSGTTLLATLLDGHSQVMVFPEETFYLNKVTHLSDFTVEVGAEWLLTESACKNLALGNVERELDGNFDYSDFDFHSFEKCFWANLQRGPQTHAHVLKSMAAAYTESTSQPGKQYWVEKTPGNEHHLFRLLTWYPDMRAIYIVRDPRDVYVSYARKKQIESDGQHTLSIENFVCRWGMSVWAWQQFMGKHPGRLTICFEDLLRYPKETMTLVCRFLNVDYEAVLETPTKNRNLWWGNSMHGDKFTGISTKPIGRWQEGLSEDKVKLIEGYLGKAMICFGYQLETEQPSPARMVGHWLRHRRKKKQILGLLMRLYWPFKLPKRLERKAILKLPAEN